jgi:hypothetical protein
MQIKSTSLAGNVDRFVPLNKRVHGAVTARGGSREGQGAPASL